MRRKTLFVPLLLIICCAFAIGLRFGNVADAKATKDVLIKTLQGEVVADNTINSVKLLGKKQGDSPFYKDLRIEVTDSDNKVINTIIPGVKEGYSPDIMLGDFGLNNGLEQIFYGVNSGGSGGFGFFYVYSLAGNEVATIFDYEQFGNQNIFTGQYLDDYKVEITKQGSNDRYLIDLSLRSQEYKEMVWDSEGKLLTPKSVDISGVNTVFPYYNYLEQNYQLLVYQRITGLYGADGLGYITTQQRFGNSGFETFFQGLEIFPSNS